MRTMRGDIAYREWCKKKKREKMQAVDKRDSR